MTVFLLAYGTGNLFLSSIGDYLGPRKAMAISIVVWTFSMVLGGATGLFATVLLSRFLLGLGEGIHFPMQSTYVKAWFPKRERAKANACWFIGTSLAPAVAMPFFAWLLIHTSWHVNFFLCAALGIIPLYLVWFHTADTPRKSRKANALEIAYIEEGQAGEATAAESEGAGRGDVRGMLRENLRLVARKPLFWLLVVYYSVHNLVYWGLLTWLPTYLKAERGFTWSEMGFWASLPFVLSVACKLIGGWASDLVGRRAPFCVLATLGSAAGMYCAATVSDNLMAAGFICFGMGVLTLGAPMTFTMLQEMVPGRAISMGAGIMNGTSFLCASLGPVLIGFSMSVTGGFTGALLTLVGVALVGMLASVVLVINRY
jgi:sugar phosphate permease